MTILLQGAGLQTAAANVAPSDPIGDGLRADAAAYWTMNESSGTRVDATGHGNDLAQANSPVGASGKVGNAVSLNGSDQSLSVVSSDYIKITADFAIAGWIKLDASADNALTYMILRKLGDSYGDYYVDLEYSEVYGLLATLELADGNDSVGFLDYTTPIIKNQWYFIVAWLDSQAGTASISVNNDVPTTGALHLTPLVTSDPLLIADGTFLGEAWFFGLIDELGIWHRVLTPDERNYLYNSGAGRALFPAP